MKDFIKLGLVLAGLVIMVFLPFICGLMSIVFMPWDSTDNAKTRTRSNMTLYTDHGTGCQYLGRLGTLAPRMNAEGKQVCK